MALFDRNKRKAGMEQWAMAGVVDELKTLFVTMPPIPPTEE